MFRKRANGLIRAGLVMLAGGLLLSHWTAGRYWQSVAEFLIGMLLVFMIAGLVKQSHAHLKG